MWTRPAGIEATRDVAGYYCLEAQGRVGLMGPDGLMISIYASVFDVPLTLS